MLLLHGVDLLLDVLVVVLLLLMVLLLIIRTHHGRRHVDVTVLLRQKICPVAE